MGELPLGRYDQYADDDDVIGLTVARTHPSGWPIVRVDPPIMDAFDEFEVGKFLTWCLNNAERLHAQMVEGEPEVERILSATAPTNTTVCPCCGGSGTVQPGGVIRK